MNEKNDIMECWAKKDFTPRENQITALKWIEKQTSKYMILELPVGCHIKNAPIVKHGGGYVKVQDIKIGDKLCGPDGSVRNVLDLHRGNSTMFTIIPQYSDHLTVNGGHILSLMDHDCNVINITVNDYIKLPSYEKDNLSLYHSQSVEFDNELLQKSILNPYDVGKFIATKKMEIKVPISEYNKITDIINDSNFLDDKKLFCVPELYKYNTVDVRLKLVAGFIDNSKTNYFEDGALVISGADNINLLTDMVFIFNSLGYIAYIKNGHIYVRGDLSKIQTSVVTLPTPEKSINHVTEGFRVKYFDVDDYYGFTVDVDNLYVCSNFIATHNSGKSVIGLTASKFINGFNGSSYVLTPQIILQDQYIKDFQDGKKTIHSLKGRSNYECVDKGVSCSIGNALSPKCANCQYDEDKSLAQNAYNTVLNYKLALSFFAYTEIFKKRDLIIMDEAHTLEKQLVDFDMVTISYNRCKKYKIKYTEKTTIPEMIKWVKDYYLPKINTIISEKELLLKKIKDKTSKSVSQKDAKVIKDFESLITHVAGLEEMVLRNIEYIEDQFVLVHDKANMSLKRLYGAYSFKNLIEPKAKRFLFMSSTIPDHEGFCKDLGIDIDDVSFLSLPSDFPLENRPIYYKPVIKMNSAWNNDSNAHRREKMLDTIVSILNDNKNATGIIHSGNYRVSEWLVDNLTNRVDHTILHHNPDEFQDRNETITEFMNIDKPSILISPSCTEGLDLKDGLARFAIIVKIPFGYLGDQWIKRRLEISESWYRRYAITDIIQAGGRIVRSKDDYGAVYILDASFTYLYNSTAHMVPNWWKESIIRETTKKLDTVK